MATITQRESGLWQARIRRQGFKNLSRSFDRKADAEAWARQTESELDRGLFINRAPAEKKTFSEIAGRYIEEVLPKKRSGDRDFYRVKRLIEEFGPYSLAAIMPTMIADYRDDRLKCLSPQSVVHEIDLITRIYKVAMNEWGIALPSGIPTANISRPSISNERDRRLVRDEETRLLAAIEHTGNAHPNPWIKPIVILAIETGARQSELLSLDWADVDLSHRPWPTIKVRGVDGRETKNGDKFREIPLSPEAQRVLSELRVTKRGRVFPTTAEALKQSWQRAVKRARIQFEREALHGALTKKGLSSDEADIEVKRALPPPGRRPQAPIKPKARTLSLLRTIQCDPILTDLHFHDLRHEATSRLAARLPIHKVMKITGHKGVRMLNRYYHQRPDDVAQDMGWC